MKNVDMKLVLAQLNQWCKVNNVSVQSVYDQCKGMTLQELVYYLFGVVRDSVQQLTETQYEFTQLYNFVHDYFDNLDVQEEINNKINSLVTDGTISNLLSPIVTQMSNPEIVNSTSEMTNNTKLYILSTSGELYYFNGGSFIGSGITYGSISNAYKYNTVITAVEPLYNYSDIGSYGVNSSATINNNDVPEILRGRFLTLVNILGFNSNVIAQILYPTDPALITMPYIRTYDKGKSEIIENWTNISESNQNMYCYNDIIRDVVPLTTLNKVGSYALANTCTTANEDIPETLRGAFLTLINIKGFSGNLITQLLYGANSIFNCYYRVINENGNIYSNWITNAPKTNTYASNLTPYKWCVIGDSFTHGYFDEGEEPTIQSGKYAGQLAVYPFLIGNRNNMNVTSLATNGLRLGGDNGFVATMLNSIPEDSDYITIALGINDTPSHNNTPIGTINDSDYSTFYGAWNVLMNYLFTNFNDKHIGIIVTNGIAYSDREYVDACINIAKKWCVPYLNLNYGEQVPTMNRSGKDQSKVEVDALTARNNAFNVSANNTHPNAKAHEYESIFIENWLATI